MSQFAFTNPLIVVGVIGVAVPIIIHFFFRRRARIIEFPAMRFVLLSYKKVARRLLLHEYLLLAARCLMVALLALALAAPLWSRVVEGLKRGEKPVAAVLVMDTSMSMTRTMDGKSILDAARRRADEWIGRLTDVDKVAVIDAVRLTGTDLDKDRGELKEFMDGLAPAYAPARMAEALGLAATRLADFQDLDRMIVVFTDLQRTSFAGAGKPREPLPVYVVDVSEGMAPKNLSVSNLEIEWRSLAREEAVRVRASVTNHGEDDARRVLVRVAAGERMLAQGFVDVPANQTVDKDFMLTEIPDGPAELRIEGDDGLPGDNVAYFLIKGGSEARALLVDGDPGTGYLQSETYFLDQALNPRLYARSRVSPRTVTVFEMKNVNLEDYPVVILANVEKLEPELTETVKRYVQAGGGLLMTLGDKVNADNYNAMWGDLLPRELRGVKLAYAGAAGSAEVRAMHLETVVPDDGLHPALRVFTEPGQGDLGMARFWKYFLMQQELVPRSAVILRLTDGVPMMVEGSYGRGKVIVFASTADRAWSDLCIHPTFLPLFQQVVQHLAGTLVSKDEGGLVAGRVIEIPVASDVERVRVMSPSGEVAEAELIEEVGARRARVTRTDLPGAYLFWLERAGEDKGQPDPARADRTLILNVDPAESDLARIEPEELKARLGSGSVTVLAPGVSVDEDAARTVEKKPLAGALLVMLVALAVLELFLIRKG